MAVLCELVNQKSVACFNIRQKPEAAPAPGQCTLKCGAAWLSRGWASGQCRQVASTPFAHFRPHSLSVCTALVGSQTRLPIGTPAEHVVAGGLEGLERNLRSRPGLPLVLLQQFLGQRIRQPVGAALRHHLQRSDHGEDFFPISSHLLPALWLLRSAHQLPQIYSDDRFGLL